MGRIIQQNNGKTTVYVTGENLSGLTATNNTYYLGVDLTSGVLEKKNPNGAVINLETFTGGTVGGVTTFTNGLNANVVSATTYLNLPGDIYLTGGTYSAGTLTLTSTDSNNIVLTGFTSGGGVIETTYADLVSDILSSGLTVGAFYVITDYQTCYDQPDFDYDNNSITTGNYKQGPVEPLMVLATSVNTISSQAYQPAYPNDKITYDWTWDTTEVTSGVTFGRITERVDEFNNRTDYDHRTILFKRYRLFTERTNLRLNGSIEVLSGGTVNGTDTSFSGLTIGEVIYIPDLSPSYYEIISITDDVTMTISGDSISTGGPGLDFYGTIEQTNGTGYFSYKRTNVKTDDFIEYTTFGDAISNDYAINNFVGNYANHYQNIGNGTFILANNVFLEGGYQTNKFGDYCYNNTFGTDNSNNIWGDWCYENVSTIDIDDNIIGHSFNNNLINTNLSKNHIGNDFNNNQLLAENSDDFEDNIIGNGFNSNIIYSRFYKNEILDNFNSNIIGDFGNLDTFAFYRNYIRNGFNGNTIRQDFQNNQIGTNYQENEINGDFQGNTILNGFNNNTIGDYFAVNNIGNAFNNNNISDSFSQNTTDYNFNGNIISNEFNTNNIGTYFGNNEPSNLNLFGWSDLSTVSARTYNTFYNSLDGNIGSYILGKELVMRVISTSQYFTIKFTQWTQGANGGGFQYERQEIDSSGNTIGSSVIFTKTNNGSEVDVIVPGVVEITRGNQNGIYNAVSELAWNASVSPSGTTWNSIYTEPNNGERFAYNKIGNNFNNNTFGSDFGYSGNTQQGNVINDSFENNTIGKFMYNNVIGNYFTNNAIGDNFENNTIKNYFIGNTILDGFESNEIGNYFGNDGSAIGSPIQNTIFSNFKYNKIGNFFGNDINFPSVGGGSNGDGGNIINDDFQFNVIGDNFIFNALDLNFTNNKISNDFWFNNFDPNTSDNVIGNLFVGNSGLGGVNTPIGSGFISNTIGNYSAFNLIDTNFQYNKIGNFFGNAGLGTENQISDGFRNNNIGDYFGDDGSQTAGGNIINSVFYNNSIQNYYYDNTVEVEFYDNSIQNYYYDNTVEVEFYSNRVGTEFSGNYLSGGTGGSFGNNDIDGSFVGNSTVGSFSNNQIASTFGGNNVGYDFNANSIKIGGMKSCIIGDNFRNNTIDSNLATVDFTTGPATHVYANYNCTIFTRQDFTSRLSYYDSTDVLNIVNIDA
jgi:hypothetical protein